MRQHCFRVVPTPLCTIMCFSWERSLLVGCTNMCFFWGRASSAPACVSSWDLHRHVCLLGMSPPSPVRTCDLFWKGLPLHQHELPLGTISLCGTTFHCITRNASDRRKLGPDHPGGTGRQPDHPGGTGRRPDHPGNTRRLPKRAGVPLRRPREALRHQPW